MANKELFLSVSEIRPKLRKSERLFFIVNWARHISSIGLTAGFLVRIASNAKHGTTLLMVSALVLAIASFLQAMTNNKAHRTCAHCFQDLPAKEILSAPDSYCCPHCGEPFQAKIGSEEFQF